MITKSIITEPIVALIGRTNVGKSTLFNRLVGQDKAVISARPGTTRDRRYGPCQWRGRKIMLTDTAGLDVDSEADIDKESIKQTKRAIAEASLILFVVDGRVGVLPQDREFARELRKSKQPVVLAINKIDSKKLFQQSEEFHQLGIKDVQTVSAKTGSGTGDLLDLILTKLEGQAPKNEPEDEETEISEILSSDIKIAIIGKPNVGKSSLINKIMGEEKAIVSPIPHTTRDSQDCTILWTPEKAETNTAPIALTFIDTAGIIKHRKIHDSLQKQCIGQSLSCLKRSDLVLLMLDASEPLTVQDKTLASEILDNHKALIFVVNKWDLVKDKTTKSDKEYIQYLHGHFPYLTWAPVVFLSAKTGFKVNRLLDVIWEIYNLQNQTFSQEDLDECLKAILRKRKPRQAKGAKPPALRRLTQTNRNPLVFEITARQADNVHLAYRRFIQSEIRQRFHLMGCGIKVSFEEASKESS